MTIFKLGLIKSPRAVTSPTILASVLCSSVALAAACFYSSAGRTVFSRAMWDPVVQLSNQWSSPLARASTHGQAAAQAHPPARHRVEKYCRGFSGEKAASGAGPLAGRFFSAYSVSARGRGLRCSSKSAPASPEEATSSAPVRSRISFARLVHSESSQ